MLSAMNKTSRQDKLRMKPVGARVVGAAGLGTGIVGADNLWACLAVLAKGKPEDPEVWTATVSMCVVGAIALVTVLSTSVSFLLGLSYIWVWRAFLAAMLLEMAYFVLVFVAWVFLPHEIRSTIVSATGLGSMWLMPQVVIGFPIWGSLLILWARPRSVSPAATVHN